jgi:hypothetical protein
MMLTPKRIRLNGKVTKPAISRIHATPGTYMLDKVSGLIQNIKDPIKIIGHPNVALYRSASGVPKKCGPMTKKPSTSQAITVQATPVPTEMAPNRASRGGLPAFPALHHTKRKKVPTMSTNGPMIKAARAACIMPSSR